MSWHRLASFPGLWCTPKVKRTPSWGLQTFSIAATFSRSLMTSNSLEDGLPPQDCFAVTVRWSREERVTPRLKLCEFKLLKGCFPQKTAGRKLSVWEGWQLGITTELLREGAISL